MIVLLIVALLFAVLAIIFAVQNAAPVTVTFLLWQFQGSLALILLLTFVLGVVVAMLAALPGMVRRSSEIAGYKKKLAEMHRLTEPPEKKEAPVQDR